MAKKKLLDVKGDWKKDSTGGKVITVVGAISLASMAISLVKDLIAKNK